MNKFVFALFLIVCIASTIAQRGGGGGGRRGSGGGCTYWCKDIKGRFYCCQFGSQPVGPVGVKQGRCPHVRPQCPGHRAFGSPRTCSNDYSCPGSEKCCTDRCIGFPVCKPPRGHYGK